MRPGLGDIQFKASSGHPSEKCRMGIVGCIILEFRVEIWPLTQAPHF